MRFPLLVLIQLCSFLYAQAQQVAHAQFLGRVARVRACDPFTEGKTKERKAILKYGRPDLNAKQAIEAWVSEDSKPTVLTPQSKTLEDTMPTPELSWEGISQEEALVSPADAVGDVNAQYYVQATNGAEGALLAVYNKLTGALLSGPMPINSIWYPLGQSGIGDPMVLWDVQAQRWVISEMSGLNYGLLLAVSETDDPLGAWNTWIIPTLEFPDYAKLGIWPDAYTFTVQKSSGEVIPIYQVDRQALLENSATPTIIRYEIPKIVNDPSIPQLAIPGHWESAASPLEISQQPIFRLVDGAWNASTDRVEYYNLHPNWANPNESFVEGAFVIPVPDFDSDVCNGQTQFDCLAQPNGSKIHAMPYTIMHRVGFRQVQDSSMLVICHVADMDGADRSGIRWYQLLANDNLIALYDWGQIEDENQHFFMPSATIDGLGNLVFGFSAVGDNQYASAYWAAYDHGTLIAPSLIAQGQSNTGSKRWGDYGSMTIDPFDNRRCWYTGMHMGDDNKWETTISTTRVKRDSFDVRPSALIAPISSSSLTDQQVVTVQVRNEGLASLAGFWLYVSLNDAIPQPIWLSDVLAPGSSIFASLGPDFDFSALGEHTIKMYTVLPVDQNTSNDTLTQSITHLAQYDIQWIQSQVNSLICDTQTNLVIQLNNNGADTLHQCEIVFWLNGQTLDTVFWTGSLPYKQSTLLNHDIVGYNTGWNQVLVTLQAPNGQTDQIPDNDSLHLSFNALSGGVNVDISTLTDAYPNETSWVLYGSDNMPLMHSTPFTTPFQQFSQSICLDPDSCYRLEINDAYGDGLHSVFGSGKIWIVFEGDTLSQLIEPVFVDKTNLYFCPRPGCNLEMDLETQYAWPNDNQLGAIDIELENLSNPNIFYTSLDTGQNWKVQLLYQNLLPKLYNVFAKDTIAKCFIHEQVQIRNCTLNANFQSTYNDNTYALQVYPTGNQGAVIMRLDTTNAIWQSENIFSNISDSTLTVTIRDSVGCQQSFAIQLSSTNNAPILNFDVWPNPANTFIHIRGESGGTHYLPCVIYNILGQKVISDQLIAWNNNLQATIPVGQLPDGTYWVHVAGYAPRQILIAK